MQPRVAGAAEADVGVTPEIALARARAALETRGFTFDALGSLPGTLEAGSGGPAAAEWASCPALTLRDPFSEALRFRRTNAGELSTRVTVKATTATATSTRVAVRALSIGTYVNTYTGNPEQHACRSTGILEQEVLAAIRAG